MKLKKRLNMREGAKGFLFFAGLASALSASAQFVWDGGAAPDGNWSANNWTGAAPAVGFVGVFEFAGTASLNATNDLTGGTASAITFNSGSGAFTLSGNAIVLGGNITNNSATAQTIRLGLALGATRTVSTTSGDIVLDGVLSGGGGLTKGNTDRTLHLTGANTFSGPVSIQRGALVASSLNRVADGSASSNLGAPTTAANGEIRFGIGFQQGRLLYTGSGETTDRVLRFEGVGGMLLSQDGSGLLKITGNVSAPVNNRSHTLFLTGSTDGTGEIAGTIPNGTGTGVVSVAKSGSGIWTLSGVNRYSGPTDIAAGTLRIEGDHGAATGAVTVARGATLAGAGWIGGAVVLDGIATLRPGGAQPGTLSLSGGLTASSRSEIVFRMGGTNSFDRLAVSGGAVLDGKITLLLDAAYSPSAGDTFNLISGTISGSPVLNLPPLATPGLAWDTSRFASSGELSIVRGAGADVRYALWLQQDPPLNGPDALGSADPYGTGYDNVTRYLFGGSPAADGWPFPLEIGQEGDEVVVSFVGLRPGSASAAYTVFASTNLAAGPLAASSEFTGVLADDSDQSDILRPDDYVRRRFAAPGGDAGFFQIRASANLVDYAAPGQSLHLDTGTWTVDFPIPYSSSGGSLTVSGNGTLVLSAQNSHTGKTAVNGGTLLVNGDSSGATGDVRVASGAALGGSGILGGHVYLAKGARFRADASLAAASFSFGGFSVRDIDGLDPAVLPGSYVLITGSIDPQNILNIGRENAARVGARKLWFEAVPGALRYHVEMDIDVTAYGAIPGDGLDDAEAFHSALTDLVALGGGTLRVPPGDYDFASRREIDLEGRAVEIAGHGKGVSVLRCNNAEGIWWFNNSSGDSALVIRELTLTPNTGGSAGTALRIDNPSLSADPDLCSLEMRSVDFVPPNYLVDYFLRHVQAVRLKNAVFDDVFVHGVRGSDWDGGWKLSEYGFYLSEGDGAAFVNCYSKNNRYGYWLHDYKGAVVFDRSNGVQNERGIRVKAIATEPCTVDVLYCHINTFVNNLRVINADRVRVVELASYVQNSIPNPDWFKDIVINDCTDVLISGCAFNQPFALNRIQIDLTGTTQDVVIRGNIFNGQYWNGTGNTTAVGVGVGVSGVVETLNLYPPVPQW
jgi:autotransporter-associated beta strand protein